MTRTVASEVQELAARFLDDQSRPMIVEEVVGLLHDLQGFYSRTDAPNAADRRVALADYLSVPHRTAIQIDQALVALWFRREFPDDAQ